MISFKTVLRKKKLSTGKYPIYLRIIKERKSIFFRTPYTSLEKEWDSKQGKFNKHAMNFLNKNRLLLKFIDQATNVVTDLQQERGYYTLYDIEKALRIGSNPISGSVFVFWDEIISEMEKAGRTGNARINRDTAKSFRKYNKNKVLYFDMVTPVYLEKYEAYLRSRNGTDGGISVQMRTFRALFNTAIRRGLIKQDIYPFKIYKISKLKGKGLKKALSLDDVHKIIKLDLSGHPKLINARNYFVFSFYTRGMNFADMMKLQWKNVIDDKIYYTRSKTRTNFQIKILPPVQEILNYYRNMISNTSYVFQILLRDEMTPAQLENRKKKTLKQYNKDLKEVAALCGINNQFQAMLHATVMQTA